MMFPVRPYRVGDTRDRNAAATATAELVRGFPVEDMDNAMLLRHTLVRRRFFILKDDVSLGRFRFTTSFQVMTSPSFFVLGTGDMTATVSSSTSSKSTLRAVNSTVLFQ